MDLARIAIGLIIGAVVTIVLFTITRNQNENVNQTNNLEE